MTTTRSKCISNWTKCESCRAIVEQSKIDLHTLHDCPPSHSKNECSFGYIYEKKLFSLLKVHEASEKDGVFLDDVVLISLSAVQLCEFAIGEPVIILTKSGQCIVKSIWPMEDNILSSVFLTKRSIDELEHVEDIVEIRKMERPLLLAKTIFVEWLQEATLSENQVAEVTYLLSVHYNNRIIAKGQNLIFSFYGLKPKVKVVSIMPHHTPEDEVSILNDTLAHLRLEEESTRESFYKILIGTDWKFINVDSTAQVDMNFDQYDLSNLGGLDDIIVELKDVVSRILIATHTRGQKVSCGVVIHGVSGTGKTSLIKSLIKSIKLPVLNLCSWQIFSRYFGEAENRVKTLFQESIEKAPSVILIDELDTFCPGKSGSEQEKRVLAVLLSMLDKLNEHKVLVIGITRQLENVDAALRRPGRFDLELEIPVPDANARVAILRKLLSTYQHTVSDETIQQLGRNMSHGFVGSDLSLVCTLANTRATSNSRANTVENIDENDLMWAFSQVKPSAMREILVQVPNVKWSDIGGQRELKLNLEQVIEWPLKYPDSFAQLGLVPPRGVLLFGPPGCSKTMIAKAVATESKLNFISIKGAELFSKWVGESEKAVREVFRKARVVSPSVIFFDEIDAISGERDADSSGGSNVQERVLSQLLTEMDGIEQLNGVTIIAATNRPDRIDSALLRPGRLGRKVYVPLPDAETRRAIFKLQFGKTPVHESVDVESLVSKTEGYSGAEVVAICHEAAMRALQQDISAMRVLPEHFEYALQVVRKQTPNSLLRIYERFLEKD